MSDSDTSGSESPDSDENVDNPLVRAWDRLKSDIDTQQIREVVNVENGRPKIDPKKRKSSLKAIISGPSRVLPVVQ